MVARRLGVVEEITCASPDYLARRGTPVSPERLEGHEMVGFVSSRTGRPLPLEFTVGGEVVHVALPTRVLMGSAETSAEARQAWAGPRSGSPATASWMTSPPERLSKCSPSTRRRPPPSTFLCPAAVSAPLGSACSPTGSSTF